MVLKNWEYLKLFLQLRRHSVFNIPQKNLKIQKSLYKFSLVFPLPLQKEVSSFLLSLLMNFYNVS